LDYLLERNLVSPINLPRFWILMSGALPSPYGKAQRRIPHLPFSLFWIGIVLFVYKESEFDKNRECSSQIMIYIDLLTTPQAEDLLAEYISYASKSII